MTAVPEIRPAREWIGAPSAAGLGNPTVLLLASSLVTLALGSAAYLAGWLAWPVVIALHAAALYVIFTPLHEAVHGVAHRSKAVNRLIGRISGLLLTASFPLFRAVHLEHHSHTNDTERDPDYVVARRPRLLLPFWLLSITTEYRLHFYGRRLWRRRGEIVEALAVEAVLLSLLALAITTGGWRPLLVCWLVPCGAALTWLAFAFDFLPHYPYDSRGRYYDTRIYPGRTLNALLLGQNYHLIHHLWTTIPWYRYQGVFGSIREQLAERGARVGWRVTPLPEGAERIEETARATASS